MATDIATVIASFTPLERSGNEWRGICIFEAHDAPLIVTGEKWRCFGCGAHDHGDDAAAFLMLAESLTREDAEAQLANGRDWQPTLTRPTPPVRKYSLAALKPGKVLIVDTLAAAKAAEKLLPQYAIYAWPNGGPRWELEPLRGRDVLLWPSPDGVEAMARLEAVIADPGLACTGKVVELSGPDDVAPWDTDTKQLISWAKMRARPLKNPAQQVASLPLPSSEIEAANPVPRPSVAEPDERAATPPADAGPIADLPQDALERDISAPEPPPVQDSDWPASASPRPPRARRLRVVGGGDMDAPDPEAEPLPVEMGEDMLALRFAAQHGEDWRYVKRWGQWLGYDGEGWRRDDVDLIDRLAVEFCRQAVNWPEAKQLTPDGKRRIAQRRTAGQVRDLARSDRTIAATVDQWDSDPYIVGVPGGVFCIDTGKIIEGDRQQYVTKRCAVAPAHGKPKRWLEHLNRMMEGDESMINFLHLYAGYSATGDVSQQCFAFLYGLGQTGKGTFLLTLGELLGDYAVFSEASTFLKRQSDKHLSELARFTNARLVIVDEVPSGSVWNEERIKRCTGGGKLTVNFMQKDPFDMEIKFKIAFAGNTKPQLRRVGKEMQRRVRLVKCNAMVPDEQVDQHFRQKMIAEEGPQILNWILEGAQHWKREGLPLPEGISDATRDYMEGEDYVGDWLAECTEQSGETRRPDAYANFKAWFLRQGNDHAWGPQAWWSAMEDRGYTIRRSASDRFVKGLTLKLGANL